MTKNHNGKNISHKVIIQDITEPNLT